MQVSGAGISAAGAMWAFIRGLISQGLTLAQVVTALGTVPEVQVGEYTGTGSAQDVALNFDPIFVACFNLTDGDFVGFAVNTTNVASKSYKILAAAGPVSVVQGVLFAAAGTKKFSLGTDAGFNENAKVFQYIAIGA